MRKLPYYLVLFSLLTACSDGGTPTCVGPNGACGFDGLTPDPNRFIDPAANSNKHVTRMIALNDAQVTAYVQNKLNGYSGDGSDDYLAIAQTALQIANGESVSGVEADILNPAMYVVNSGLYVVCSGATDAAACVSDWGTENASLLAQRLTELRARADLLDISSVDFATSTGSDTNLTFSVDASGKITGVSVGGTDYARNGNSNTFTNGDSTLTYNSGVISQDTGILSYSDFGVYQITTGGVAGNNIPFAGGYETQKIAENDIQTAISSDMTFSGAAVGTVTNSENHVLDIADNRASLVFSKETGSSTLNANFSNWYNISVTKDMNTTDANITFSGYKGPEGYQVSSDVSGGTASMNIGYYGPNPETGVPTEATGLVGFSDGGIDMSVAFGVK